MAFLILLLIGMAVRMAKALSLSLLFPISAVKISHGIPHAFTFAESG